MTKKYDYEKEFAKNSLNFTKVKGIAIKLQDKYPNKCVYCGKEKTKGKQCTCMFGGAFD